MKINEITGCVLLASAGCLGWRWYEPDAGANPNSAGATVVSGTATFQTSGSHETITTSAGTYINWSSFNINAGETTTFVQPSATSVVWNNINDANPSQILGTLNANGYVVLQSQAGFYIGGQATINTHGLIMTTAGGPTPNLNSAGAWEFDAPPPAAKIINYGQINITGGGTAYLIASDIENDGTLSAPGGHIGLYAGQKVLVSMNPNGLGLSAEVTLPQGSVDNNGKLVADAGSVAAQAQYVNQSGLVQANSVQNVNGTIELVASDSVNLGANSAITAKGDSTAVSAGGAVTIQAGSGFADQAGSVIDVSGSAQGGAGGQVSIAAPQMSAINSTINGQAASGYADASLSIDTEAITLNGTGNPVAGQLALDVNGLSSGFSQLNLQASGNVEVSSLLTLTPASGVLNTVSLIAGGTLTVDAGAGIEANGGKISLIADNVNQNGLLEANSVKNANGVVEIDADSGIALGATSQIEANGDSTTTSPGGFVVLNAGYGKGTFADMSGSSISVAGHAGGQSGIVEILGSGVTAGSLNSTYGSPFAFLINPNNLTLSTAATTIGTTPGSSPNINVGNLASYSQIDLLASDNTIIETPWSLAANLTLNAGNSILVNSQDSIVDSGNGDVTLNADSAFLPLAGFVQARPSPGSFASPSYGIYLGDSAYVQTQAGNINVSALNEVIVADDGSSGSDGIRTLGGGSITVTATDGNVDTGDNLNGFVFNSQPNSTGTPYYTISSLVGGISTAAGGNVTINAGGNVYSDYAGGSLVKDPGTGAFGPNPGNLTINAGGSVFGNYVVADGVGSITAGANIGSASGQFALSLVSGSWNVSAPNGDIYLQEVLNPNGVFNYGSNTKPISRGYKGTTGQNLFDYSADASVSLDAQGVVFTGQALPRLSGDGVPTLYPPILDVTAGAGGVTLNGDLTLFPSVDQALYITTTDGGSLTGVGVGGANPQLLMSDSSATSWKNSSTFSDTDNSASLPIQAGDPNPSLIDVAGNMENLTLIMSKASAITVGGDMDNCAFSGQNLSASDVTSITVGGQIYNSPLYAFVDGMAIPAVPGNDLLTGVGNTWDAIFALAVNPALIPTPAYLQSQNVTQNNLLPSIIEAASLFNTTYAGGKYTSGGDQGFVYNASTGQLGYEGQMPASLLALLSQPLTILTLVNGLPVVGANGKYETTTVNWVNPSQLATLYTESQSDVSNPSIISEGYRVGGPGQFDITAGSISLGNSYGILSCGVADPTGGFDRYNDLASVTPEGASLNVTVTGDLDMLTSTIATLGGGNVTVTSTDGSMDLGTAGLSSGGRQVGYGIYSAEGGDVTVTALSDINIDGSRIGTYDGGTITVESMTGDVDVGSGGNTIAGVFLTYVNPATGSAESYAESVAGSGVVAYTLVPGSLIQGYPPGDVPTAASPGDIIITADEGSIDSTIGGITQLALNGSSASGPYIDLTAGMNIDLGDSGAIGGKIVLNAKGSIIGAFFGRQSVTATATSIAATIDAPVVQANAPTLSGNVIGGTVNISGNNISADVVSANANGSSTLGKATVSAAGQSAAQQASISNQQLANDADTSDDQDKKKKTAKPQIQRIKRVTVILPKET